MTLVELSTHGRMRVRMPGKELGLSIALGVSLLAASYVRIWGDTGSAAFRDAVIDASLVGPIWGTALGNNLLAFGLTQLIVHTAFALLCLLAAHLSKAAWPRSENSICTWTLLWFVLGSGWIVVANAAEYRWSSLGQPYAEFVTASWRGVSLYSVYTTLMLALVALVAAFSVRRLIQGAVSPFVKVALPAAFAIGLALAFGFHESDATGRAHDKPHVIIIGLDSLRYDVVRQTPRSITPAIDDFLDEAINFSDATTPLARTFPSWTSIITGKHPHTTGAIINLLPRKMIRTGNTLPQLLRQQGYQTVYATDEVRFSNLDTSYGFERMIAPPMGATDFLLGFFGDAPLSNLLTNSPFGEWLYPYLYANRAAAHVYDPDTFIDRLDNRLRLDEPTFLAVHLTLAHWPFRWADTPVEPDEEGESAARHFYDPAVARLDQQFKRLMTLLEERSALKNAIVIVLSDHGESLGRLNPKPRPDGEHVEVEFEDDRLIGHGSSVFSRHQYHVLFCVRSYGETPFSSVAPRSINAPVSLMDITPTLVDALAVRTDPQFEGTSLMQLVLGGAGSPALEDRIRLTETEFNPPGVLSDTVVPASALWDAATYYRVDPETDRVLIKAERLQELLENRQYAAFRNKKLIAAVPNVGESTSSHRPVLMIGGAAPVALSNPENHSDPDVRELWSALLTRFPGLHDGFDAHSTNRATTP